MMRWMRINPHSIMETPTQTQTPSKATFIKIPNVIGLYRHVASGRYYGVKKVKNKRKERSLGTTDRKIAERRMAEWLASLERVDTEVEKTTFNELAKSYLAINTGKSESTQYIIRSTIDDFAKFMSLRGLHNPQVRHIRTQHLELWLSGLESQHRNTSYNRYAGVLRGLFRFAVNDKIIAESPFERVRTPWKKPEDVVRRVPTMEQFKAIVASVRNMRISRFGNDTANFLEFLCYAGVGQAEASSLTWGDIDFQRGRIYYRRHKTNRRFSTPIFPDLNDLLQRLLKKHGGHPQGNERVLAILDGRIALRNACARLNLPHFTQRNIRQLHIKQLWKAGVDKKLIAAWQGHQDGGKLIMDTYTEVFGSDDDHYEAAQLAKLVPPLAKAA